MRIIKCSYFGKECEGLDYKLYPGPLGEKIYNEISKEAWELWLSKQTMLINEKKLNMMNIEDRKFIESQMNKFLFEKQNIDIEGYKPIDTN